MTCLTGSIGSLADKLCWQYNDEWEKCNTTMCLILKHVYITGYDLQDVTHKDDLKMDVF
jgi:hypothetical protein